MKNYLSKKYFLGAAVVAAICMLTANTAKAQEFTVQGDIVSTYVWRGYNQGGGAAFQPTLGFGIGNFYIGAWGSTNFNGGKKELDLSASYTFGENGPTLSLTDYWWKGEAEPSDERNKYFNYNAHETNHFFEAGLSYTLPIEKIPLSVAWYTMFAGADKRYGAEGEEKNNYSSYVELNYPFVVKSCNLNLTCGFLPYQTNTIYNLPNSGFAVTNVALKAMKEIKINDKFSLPIFVQGIWNPRYEDAYLVFGLTLRP